ncbi:hypothetical protein [Ottowia sp.]|uniref:hypothetical protein n=1 Tax=Ottowia sp. TaxID=1898956 RepID=UPI002621498F|nr:hypothetical protein [Ottowia sp.]
MAADYVGWGIGIIGIVAATGVAVWAGLRQSPRPDVRIDGVALKYLSIGEGENLFIATVTNHGSAVAEIARTEVRATIEGVPMKASIGAMDVAGTLAAGTSKELWLDVALPTPINNDVHDGHKRLRVTVTLHPTKGKAIRSSFDFSRDPGYGFVPSATP